MCYEVEMLCKFLYDECVEKNFLRKISLELIRFLSDMKDKDVKDWDKVKELRREKDCLFIEN